MRFVVCWPNAQDGCNVFLAFHEAVMKKNGQNLDAEEWAMKTQGIVFGEWRDREEEKKKCERVHRNEKLFGPFNVAGPQGEWFFVKLCDGCYKDGEEAMRALTENVMGERGRSLARKVPVGLAKAESFRSSPRRPSSQRRAGDQ